MLYNIMGSSRLLCEYCSIVVPFPTLIRGVQNPSESLTQPFGESTIS